MMQIAALYDIHGNLPALEAVLDEFKTVRPDVIVVGGDVVSGPQPLAVLERLLSLGERARFLRGNGDREVVTAFDGLPLPANLSEKGQEVTRWVADQLNHEQRDLLASWPETLRLDEILFCHATPRSDLEIFTPRTASERLAALFAEVDAQQVICGHTHMQFELRTGNIQILNAGSVGMPFMDQPGAYWLLLGPDGYEFRRTEYDVEAAAQKIRKSGYPQAEEFAERNVLHPPSVAAATDMLERMAG